jgi:hypothetical protein
MGRAIHSKRNRHARGFSFARADWGRVVVFVECRQPEKVLPLKMPEVARFNLEYFSLLSQVYIPKNQKSRIT